MSWDDNVRFPRSYFFLRAVTKSCYMCGEWVIRDAATVGAVIDLLRVVLYHDIFEGEGYLTRSKYECFDQRCYSTGCLS